MSPQPNSSLHPGVPDYGRTHWSVVVGVHSDNEQAAQRSLADLCRRYWVPVYAYVRRCGHPPESASALVQAFLGHTIREIRDTGPPQEPSFRVYLQRRLERFLASDWTELEMHAPSDEVSPPWPLDAIEKRQNAEPLRALNPAQAFQQAFALELLSQGLQDLRAEAGRSGRGAMFDVLHPYLTRDAGPGEYAMLARQLQTTPLAVVVAVKRLRQRFQELTDAHLAQTIGGPLAFDTERQTLLTLLFFGPEE